METDESRQGHVVAVLRCHPEREGGHVKVTLTDWHLIRDLSTAKEFALPAKSLLPYCVLWEAESQTRLTCPGWAAFGIGL